MVGSSDQRGAAKSNSRGPRWPQNARKPRKRSSQARPSSLVASASNSSGAASARANSGASGRAASISSSSRTEISVVGLPRMPATSRRCASGKGANRRSTAIHVRSVTVSICMPSRRAPASVDSHSRSSASSAWDVERLDRGPARDRGRRRLRGRRGTPWAAGRAASPASDRTIDHTDWQRGRASAAAQAPRREDAARQQIVDHGAGAVVDVVERRAQERAEHRDRERRVEVEVDAALDAIEARHLARRSASCRGTPKKRSVRKGRMVSRQSDQVSGWSGSGIVSRTFQFDHTVIGPSSASAKLRSTIQRGGIDGGRDRPRLEPDDRRRTVGSDRRSPRSLARSPTRDRAARRAPRRDAPLRRRAARPRRRRGLPPVALDESMLAPALPAAEPGAVDPEAFGLGLPADQRLAEPGDRFEHDARRRRRWDRA